MRSRLSSWPPRLPRNSTLLRSSFRLADITAGDGIMSQYDNVDGHERIPLFDYIQDTQIMLNRSGFPRTLSKSFDQTTFLATSNGAIIPLKWLATTTEITKPAIYQSQHLTRAYLVRSFQQNDRLPNSMSMTNMANQWIPSADMMQPQTITPAQAFPQPMTPPSSYARLPGIC